jgi:hypothetical protein
VDAARLRDHVARPGAFNPHPGPWWEGSAPLERAKGLLLAQQHQEIAGLERQQRVVAELVLLELVAEQATREGTAEADPGPGGYAPGDTQEFGAVRVTSLE